MSTEHTAWTSWKGVRPVQDPTGRAYDVQMGYCDGYALALDDLFKNLNEIEQRRQWNPESRALLRQVRQAMHNMRGGAQQTMKMLMREALHEHQQPVQAQLGEDLSGDLGGVPRQSPLQDAAPE